MKKLIIVFLLVTSLLVGCTSKKNSDDSVELVFQPTKKSKKDSSISLGIQNVSAGYMNPAKQQGESCAF